ncbi:unnamed protein product [Plutella xylostella]|uniref:(diamondback moth) hypothetical protein n=1 Tax=Plutella xylostella TaxID=51655 RepID=A0A8S4FNE4_PLUXY|nr:unnamed protein product [Plutella xylostella]
MDLITSKAVAMLALGLGSFIAGMLPVSFSDRARQKNPLLLSSLLCFGAGVLLSTSLVHMLPEAREKLPQYSELCLCVGFFLVYLVDEIVHFFYGAKGGGHGHSEADYGTTERDGLLSAQRAYGSHLPSSSHDDGEMHMKEKCCGDAGSPRMCHVSHTPPCNKSSSGMIGLLGALFVHSILEGLAIGLQESASQVLLLLAAVSAHKYVVGFCLGAELCSSLAGRRGAHLACVLVFSSGSVVGIAVGAGLDALSFSQGSVAVPVMQALAAGTLLYVTVSEVLPRERARWHDGRRGAGAVQLLAVIVGFVLMYLTTAYLDHDG